MTSALILPALQPMHKNTSYGLIHILNCLFDVASEATIIRIVHLYSYITSAASAFLHHKIENTAKLLHCGRRALHSGHRAFETFVPAAGPAAAGPATVQPKLGSAAAVAAAAAFAELLAAAGLL